MTEIESRRITRGGTAPFLERLWLCKLILFGALPLVIPIGVKAESAIEHLAHPAMQADNNRGMKKNDSLEYRIGPGDLLDIVVWKEPDFSGEFKVRFDGRISLPLVGDVAASERTPEELGRVLEQELGRYVEVPRATVTVKEVKSAQFFVLGKVSTQGAFPYTGRLRVVQALALAGGFQEFAKLDKIFVIRSTESGQTHFPVNYEKMVNDRNLDSNIIILPGDTIIVP